MVEKKTNRISVRIPYSWKMKLRERGIEVSYICRSALFQALQQSDEVMKAGAKLHSKQQAAALFNSLVYIRSNYTFKQNEPELILKSVKLPFFRTLIQPLCTAKELIILGEFLDQNEYAEEILQEAFRM